MLTKRERVARQELKVRKELGRWASAAGIDPERFAVPADLIENAARIAPHVPIPQEVLDYLYANRRSGWPSQAAWEEDVRMAIGIDRIVRAHLRQLPLDAFDGFLDRTAMAAAAELASREGTLVLIWHGGFSSLSGKVFRGIMPNQILIGSEPIKRDAGSAVFGGRRAIEEGRPALIAPDGLFGKQTCTMDILGVSCGTADGAAFLAHDTGCRTLWAELVRTDTGFVPHLVAGPRRESNEPFRPFRDRLYRFYAAQIETSFTGEPRNIALADRWILRLSAMLADRKMTD